jgi:peptidoglycan/LPS O-acetylase OafA/YrhL
MLTLVPLYLLGSTVKLADGEIARFPSALQFVANIFQLQGLLVPNNLFDAPMWSLSIECLFYLLTPLFRRANHRILLLLILASVGAQVWQHFARHFSLFYQQHGIGAAECLYAWLGGFYYYKFRSSKFAIPVLFLAVFMFASHMVRRGDIFDDFNPFLASVVVYSASRIRLLPIYSKVLVYLGEISYPLYVGHWPVYMVMLAVFRHYNTPNAICALAMIPCFVVAMLMYHFIDVPIRRNKYVAV